MYKAIVTRLKNVRPHPNADRVQLATCHGNQVVVGLDSKEGDWGMYFPCDGQLSHEFCHANNLYRDKTKNKFPDEKAGMFDDNRRVRAQRFRGEVSDGFWTPLHSFGFIYVTGLDVEGLELDEWGGVPICNKYINPNTLKAAQQNQGKKTRVAKSSVMFKEHIDTEHFGKNVHQIKRDDLVIITEKLHGCVHYDSIVNTIEYGDVKIGWLVDNKISAKIKAMDTTTHEIVYVPIDAHYFLANDGVWYEMELENGTTLKITGNNPVWLPDLGVYRRVDELVGDENILFNDEGIVNVFQRDEVKNKIKETLKKKYNVEHPMSINGIKERIKENCIKKYGVEHPMLLSWVRAKQRSNISHNKLTKIHKQVNDHLTQNGFNTDLEFELLDGNKSYFYDILIIGSNKIIEVNGDYWHFNPLFYKATDIVKIPGNSEYLVGDKWLYDEYKNNLAIKNGYEVLVIWEYDLKTDKKNTLNKIIEYGKS